MRCPKCHAEIEEGYLYCKNCGEEIRIVPDYDPQVEDMLSGSLKDVVKEAQQNASEKAAGVQSAAGQSGEKTASNAGASASRKTEGTSRTAGNGRKRHSRKRRLTEGVLCICILAIAGLISVTLFRRNSYDYQYQLAVKAAADNDADRALKYLSRAMELEPDQTYMWLFKAQIEKDSGDREAAEESCRYILSKLDPDNQEVYTMLIEMYIEEGDLDSVKDTLSRCPVQAVKNSFADYIAAVPTASFADGIYYDTMEIELDADGLDIYFTTDGTKPTVNSTKYEGPIRLTEGSNTIRAVAVSPKGVLSDEAIFSYEISYLEAEPPVVSPDSGEYPAEVEIVVQVPDGCTVLYTLDGSLPTLDSAVYEAPVKIRTSTVFTAVSVSMSGRFSESVVRRYTIDGSASGDEE
ncbi:chitobiase/beta-hexosaminidase C-terminal domain-containing protein [Oscillospiraceae bacterium Marseille-Q3528]|nr:chitobiase/beta-hexosaminidase C-terminal domain-containing protein [Oscillospiraceae bacterium Marseille-Q3528]WNV56570.1 chitobiase/beta-hexosaminidase C-terminal domain-containing protein [Oscillospiraceae bacterium NTUH-002-81]